MAKPRSRALMHPLCGADIATLTRVLLGNGGIAGRALPQAGIALAATLARLPFTALERVFVEQKLRAAGEMPAPIFIIGHWRSGTTHLFNILSRGDFGYISPVAAGMPWDFMGLGEISRSVFERMLPKERYIDAIPVAPDSPQEDEVPLANMTPLSFYHGIYFPRSFARNQARGIFFDGCTRAEIASWKRSFVYLSRKTWLHCGRRPLLIKNPVHTARIGAILEIWPEAKFVHCVRDPFEIFVSMRNFYRELFRRFALQDYAQVPIEGVVIDGYARLMDRFLADRPAIPDGQFHELRYERLAARPMDEIARLYAALGLDGFDEAAPDFRAYLDSIRGYQRNRHAEASGDRARVEAAWGRYIDHWRYRRPAA